MEALRALQKLLPSPMWLTLPEGAADAAISECEQRLGIAFPPALRDLYRQHNGEITEWRSPFAGLLFGYPFLPLSLVETERKAWLELVEFWKRSGDPEPYPSHPAGAVRSTMFDGAWIPLAGIRSGCHLAVDLNPGPTGVVGQIINCGRDDIEHFQLAMSVEALLDAVEAT